jgi:hypothetical protein
MPSENPASAPTIDAIRGPDEPYATIVGDGRPACNQDAATHESAVRTVGNVVLFWTLPLISFSVASGQPGG